MRRRMRRQIWKDLRRPAPLQEEENVGEEVEGKEVAVMVEEQSPVGIDAEVKVSWEGNLQDTHGEEEVEVRWRQKFWRPSPQKLMKEEVDKWETRREKWRRRNWSRRSRPRRSHREVVWRGWQHWLDRDEDLESEASYAGECEDVPPIVVSSSDGEPWLRGQ